MADRVDVHQHVIPPCWVEGLQSRNSKHRPPAWSPEIALDWMDEQGIATGYLSLTAPGFEGWAVEDSKMAARQVNEYTAGLCSRWPTRFGNFAVLPLPDIDSSLSELAFAFDELSADGIVLFSNYGERFLGDPFLEPLWAELDRRHAIIFVHPTRLSQPELKGITAPLVDFPFATTRTALQMVMNGVMDRYQGLRVILSHGGGFLPYAAYRFASLAAGGRPGSVASPNFDADLRGMIEKFRRFYLDMALASGPTALPSLKAFADPTRLLFGSDYPYGPGGVSEYFANMFDTSELFSSAEQEAVDHLNAAALFRGRHCGTSDMA